MKMSRLFPVILITFLLLAMNDVGAKPAPANSYYEQPIPKPIRKIIKAIEKANVFVLQKPEQTSPLITDLEENYFLLSKLATSDELEGLIRTHKNAVVRLYAFKALTTQVHNIPGVTMDIINNDRAIIACIKGDKTENVELRILAQNFLN